MACTMNALILRFLTLSILLRQASSLTLKEDGNPKEICIDEDMCVSTRHRNDTYDVFAEPAEKSVRGVDPACTGQEPKNLRVVLFTLCAAYHGSTALEGVLLGSDKLATLCAFQDWQCEGKSIMRENGYEEDDLTNWNYTDMLRLYSEVWDLRKPVLLEKNPDQIWYEQEEDDAVRASPLPRTFKAASITKLDLVYIMMWRPYCLGWLSSDFRAYPHSERIGFELSVLAVQIEAHKRLIKQGVRVLVVNFADLIFRPDYVQERLNQFLPCLGYLNIDYVPKLGKDIFEKNQWKATGTVREFGRSVNPWTCCGYSMQNYRCESTSTNEMPTGDNMKKYQSFIDYLNKYS